MKIAIIEMLSILFKYKVQKYRDRKKLIIKFKLLRNKLFTIFKMIIISAPKIDFNHYPIPILQIFS